MKFFPLVWAALWRRRPRTVFTMLSIAVAFLLYGILTAITQAFNAGVEMSGADRLITTGRYSLTQILPEGHGNVIRSIDGVASVAGQSWFGGVYQDERNFFAQFPTEIEPYLAMYPEIVLAAEQKQAMLRNRTGALVSKTLADRFAWKLGDRIPLIASIWPNKETENHWELELMGIFDTADPALRSQYEMLLFHHEYFDEARTFGKGNIGWFVAKITDTARSAEIGAEIDAAFRNSPHETRSQAEKAFNQGFIKQIGDIGLVFQSILGAVFFTLLFLTGNTMMQSVRERTPELAVLKTIGYSDGRVLALVMAEALLLCLGAALAGLACAAVLLPPIADRMPGLSGLELTGAAVLEGFAVAVLLAFVIGLLPALRAQRLEIVAALSEHGA